jgi:uncharacterized protein with NAD-binding domain and iron-sulfur cluster
MRHASAQAWRSFAQFDNIHKLVGVPVITVQLRYNGWITELQNPAVVQVSGRAPWSCLLRHAATLRSQARARRCNGFWPPLASGAPGKSGGGGALPHDTLACSQMCILGAFSNAPQDLANGPRGLDNLLYSADADFSCFADLALTSPVDYFKEGEGSLMQCVITPKDIRQYMAAPNEEITAKVHQQVRGRHCLGFRV